jgi:hypothetical protein
MKKRILLFTVITGMGYLLFTSYASGPAANGQNRSGAKASTTNCGTVGSGCHGTGTSTVVSIEVDSTGGVPTTHYKPGNVYTVKIHGTNSSSLPKFGFQYAVVSGTGASQVQAGTSSGFPTGVTTHSLSSLSFVEHTSARTATSAGVYDVSFTWTAPSSLVGNITMYCTLNAVNASTSADAADISGNTSVVLTPVVTPSSVSEVSSGFGITAFPNPVSNVLHLQTGNVQAGDYSLYVFDMSGRIISAEIITVNGTIQQSINTSAWAPGLYQVVIENAAQRQVIPVVK